MVGRACESRLVRRDIGGTRKLNPPYKSSFQSLLHEKRRDAGNGPKSGPSPWPPRRSHGGNGGPAAMTAATALGERLIASELIGVEIVGVEPAAELSTRAAAAESIDGPLNAPAAPTIKLLPLASPLATPMTTVPDCTISPPENPLAASSTSLPRPIHRQAAAAVDRIGHRKRTCGGGAERRVAGKLDGRSDVCRPPARRPSHHRPAAGAPPCSVRLPPNPWQSCNWSQHC